MRKGIFTHDAVVRHVEELEAMNHKGLSPVRRFTDDSGRKLPMTSSEDAYKQLAAYEQTGVTPEIVKLLKEA